MQIDTNGKITEGFFVAGHPGAPIYLLDGPAPVLIDAGYLLLAPLYEADIRKILGNRPPAYLLITHSHFDHIGSVSYLKHIWPEMKIAGSEKVGLILKRPHAVELISSLSAETVKIMEYLGITEVYDGPFEPFQLDISLRPDQVIELDEDLTIRCLCTPGHTWDFMSYYVPERKILVASEAVGCSDGKGYIWTEFLVDYEVYMNSINRLSQLDFQVLCVGHRFVLTGEDAKEHLRQATLQGEQYAAMIEAFLREERGNVDKTVDRVKSTEWDPRPYPKQPERPYIINTSVRVKHLWKRMSKAVER
jgi:2-aminobenzoylacetyl-CoA thioesterase